MRRLIVAAVSMTILGAATGNAVAGPDRWGTVWLCRPGLANDPCTFNRTATVVQRDGTSHVLAGKPSKRRNVDCFYVYPTVSRQQTDNANLHIDPEERTVAVFQASRFSAACRLYAPMYPQITLKALSKGITPREGAKAYVGLLAAWRNYISHYNHGRGIVFLGHSQGAALLIGLIAHEVDPNLALRRRLVSALLLGGNATVAKGRTIGGNFKHIPGCRTTRQLGCVVAYSSFESTPPSDSNFGRVGVGLNPFKPPGPPGHLSVLCVNPAALGGGAGTLQPFFTTRSLALLKPRSKSLPAPSTPWVTYPNEYRARCRSAGGATWLQVTPDRRASDPRPLVTELQGPRWGLHLFDVNLTLGNLVALVRSEAAAYRGHRRSRRHRRHRRWPPRSATRHREWRFTPACRN